MLKWFLTRFYVAKAIDQLTIAGADTTGGANNYQLDDATKAVYSKMIQFKALPQFRFAQFATEKTELNQGPGSVIQMYSYDDITAGGALTEGLDIEKKKMSGSLKSITVQEYGNATSQSEFLFRTSWLNTLADATKLLSRDYALTLEKSLRDTATGANATNIVYARSTDTPDTKVANQRDVTATCKFQKSTVSDAVEILATNNAPKWQGNDWICFVHPHQARDLRDDSGWINASNYGNPELIFNGEIGKIDSTRFIESSIMPNGVTGSDGYDVTLKAGEACTGGTNAVNLYKAVIFGEDFFGIAWALPVEFRDDGVEDFGRKRSFAWYAIWGTGILNAGFGVKIFTA